MMSRIAKVFHNLKKSGRKALIPYIMSGDPSLKATMKYVLDLEKSGADMIELGVPFTDPLADGPTIQRSSERSLRHGTTLRKVLALVKDIRKQTDIPLILMTYCNPVFRFGTKAFVEEAVKAGVDGLIIPDLIPDEAHDFIMISRQKSLDTIFLLAPTSTYDRIKKVAKSSTGFIYFVSITGITGSKLSISKDMKDTLRVVKRISDKPVALGFGISSADEASVMAKLADGIIIGSALVRLIAKRKDIKQFVQSIRRVI